jgi:hypothetical protein
MSDYKTEISHDDYLKVIALATMANDHYVKSSECAMVVNRLIMQTAEQYPGGHVDDLIYTGERLTVAQIDEAIRKEGITVLPAIAPTEE